MNWEAVSAVASTLIALAALVFSVVSFQRQQNRAAEQQADAQALAVASVKPLLWVHGQSFIDLKTILLRNYGLGPAVLRRVEFSKEGHPVTNRVADLFDLRIPGEQSKIFWETFDAIRQNRAIPAQGEIRLLWQSLGHLMGQGVEELEGLALLAEWQEQRSGVRVFIEYEDILGNRLQPIDFTFR
jgi:hypothetical protein